MRAPGRKTYSLPHFFGAVAGLTVAAVLQGAALAQWKTAVYNPLSSNKAAITTVPSNGPPTSLPAPDQLRLADGYNVTIASIVFIFAVLVPLLVAATVAPRWFWGTRMEYYAQQLQKLHAAGVGDGVPVQVVYAGGGGGAVGGSVQQWGMVTPGGGILPVAQPVGYQQQPQRW